MNKALLVIDVQNDYFADGKFPLWNAETVSENVEKAVRRAKDNDIPLIYIQHVVKQEQAPFFGEETPGVEINSRILAAAPDAPIIVKQNADSFQGTTLEEVLNKLDVTELLVCGMMTHNCVTHTAISKSAEKYAITVLPDCCTTVSEIIHLLALDALSNRVKLIPSTKAL
ncbi:MAG: cysteine hydrolase [Gimesia sp.]|uniref:cysteine hydrolase family protein n=1 Tax=Gimesia sp. TaxID=2024833 RepID=UPI000C6B9980|nr:cysteine hydrolase family protein [Gimesia sp.]MAX38827.1 cysteine hydrolase [Gimesia sp.]|tara:strand:+ start:4352 stop:4861 length:510 start_codon:yes stop_codon:yes gene_type:complete